MGLTLPPELAGLLHQAGGKWPEADEDALHRLAGDWRSVATQFRTAADGTSRVSTNIAGQHQGQSIDAYLTQSAEVQQHLRLGATAADQTANGVDGMAKATLQTKTTMVSGLQQTHQKIQRAQGAAFLGPLLRILLQILGKFLWRVLKFLASWIWRIIVAIFKAIWWVIKKVIDFFKRLFSKGGKKKPPKPKDNGRWGPLEKVNKPDPQADKLAKKIGGESRVKFKNDPKGREYDTVSDKYVAQTKPANFTLNKRFREQARATFEVAKDTGRTPYFHFEGPPGPGVIEAIKRYGREYGINPIIDISPL
jgi:restriction endonuclease fold toxin 3 of polymorphic toxin system